MTAPAVNLARPWKAKRALLSFCLDAVDRACADGPRFVQVGANDGRLADPIRGYIETGRWHGLMIEPHPAYFADLAGLHGKRPCVALANCAVSDAEGEMELFHLSETRRDAYPPWARGCASLRRERLIEVLAGQCSDGEAADVGEDIDSVRVPVRRLDALLAEHGLDALDILVVDVEGFEINVLKSLDLSTLDLRACMVECNGSDAPREAEIAAMLRAAGLVTFRLRDDLFAVHPDRLAVPVVDLMAFLGQSPVDEDTP